MSILGQNIKDLEGAMTSEEKADRKQFKAAEKEFKNSQKSRTNLEKQLAKARKKSDKAVNNEHKMARKLTAAQSSHDNAVIDVRKAQEMIKTREADLHRAEATFETRRIEMQNAAQRKETHAHHHRATRAEIDSRKTEDQANKEPNNMGLLGTRAEKPAQTSGPLSANR
ncbi:uncharacterized protein EI90DRAFT_3131900 [Cantharellus anzutake]|uniref:uncharacterized protein n=1 Tax=Cantharellus anzutake TaxID=1750568 RepID=UPI001903C3ED|nr:uncharacterized protein EI90DRAFT_3131900 [Cantharellus anzutake]KAF8320532.1 hypothetical protein EI90DRAFT_3131900 [Cantharellus anzutake]